MKIIKDLRRPVPSVQASIYDNAEFEKIVRDMRKNVKEKYKDREDLQKFFDEEVLDNESKLTFMIMPGTLVEYENPQRNLNPYPMSDAMYSHGLPWS